MSSVLKPYDKYKDSGVSWLGEVPEGWGVKPVRYISKISNGSTPKSSHIEYWDGDIVWITPSDLEEYNQYISDSKRKITKWGLNSCGTELTPPESLIISTRAPIGSMALTKTFTCTNQGCKTLFFNDRENSRFYYYFFLTSKGILQVFGKGTTFLELSSSELSSFFVVSPPLPEQQAIADYLDTQTQRIDSLVQEQKDLIKLLKEKRQALISHCVTKGLDPNAKMKDSGVEWLGEVPEGWDIKPLKHVVSCNDESLNETTDPDFELDYIEISDVDLRQGIINSTKMKFSKAPSRARRVIRKGDVIVSTVRTYLRAITSVTFDPQNHVVSTGFAVLRPKKVYSSYLRYLFQAEYLISEIIARSVGVSYPAINSSEILRLSIPIPFTHLQQAIADYLDKETDKIDTLIQEAEETITLMQEHRSALISAVVTGKVRVPGVSA
jgi:type I restriction enzyme S subunit